MYGQQGTTPVHVKSGAMVALELLIVALPSVTSAAGHAGGCSSKNVTVPVELDGETMAVSCTGSPHWT